METVTVCTCPIDEVFKRRGEPKFQARIDSIVAYINKRNKVRIVGKSRLRIVLPTEVTDLGIDDVNEVFNEVASRDGSLKDWVEALAKRKRDLNIPTPQLPKPLD